MAAAASLQVWVDSLEQRPVEVVAAERAVLDSSVAKMVNAVAAETAAGASTGEAQTRTAELQVREEAEAFRRQCRKVLAAGLAEAWALAARRLQEAEAGAVAEVEALLAAGQEGLASGGAGSAREALAAGVGRLLDRGLQEARAAAMEEVQRAVAAGVVGLRSADALERHAECLRVSREHLQQELARAQGLEVSETHTEESLADAASSEPADEEGPQTALEPLRVGLLFPGETSRCVGMLRDVQHIPAVAEMLKVAEAVLGWDLLATCLYGPESKLMEFAEPAMFVAGMAGLEKLKLERPEVAQRFQVCAGLGVGELTALCAAGVFSFADGLRLAVTRSKAMRKAAAACQQAMLSVKGREKSVVQELCGKAQRMEGGGAVCLIAQEWFPKGFACAGTRAATLHLNNLCNKRGVGVAVIREMAGNTPLMLPAKNELVRTLEDLLPKMKPPKHTVFMNATAEAVTPGTEPREIVELIARQVTSPVLWELSVRNMIKSGVKEYCEIRPNFLEAMMERIDSEVGRTTTHVKV